MNVRRNRRLSGIIGAFLLLIGVGVGVVAGMGLFDTPTLLAQVTCLGLAGVFDIVSATDNRLTDRWAWYRWSGLGNVLLGISLPLAFLGSGEQVFLLGVVAVGGFSLAAMGIDMLAFHGKYTRGERLDRD